MMMIFKLGIRNIIKQKRRSLVVILSIAIGIFAMIMTISVTNGINDQMIENTITTSLGHIAIHKTGFQDNMSLDKCFSQDPAMFEKIKHVDKVVSCAPKVKVQGMLRSSEGSSGVMIMGVDPGKEKLVSKIEYYTNKTEGSSFLEALDDDSILISKTMAKKLGLIVGDKLVLMIQNKDNEMIGVGLKVRGLFQTPVDSFDKFVVYTGIKKLQNITGLKDEISEITILLENKNDADKTKQMLQREIHNASLEILSWKDMAPNLISMVGLVDTFTYVAFAIIFITIIFTIANTLIMAIMERFHEIGVMKSIGTRPSVIFKIFMVEAILLGTIGLCVGLFAGVVLTGILYWVGIDLSIFKDSLRMWGAGSIIFPKIGISDILVSAMIIYTTTFVAALYPALKAARIKPLEALNYI